MSQTFSLARYRCSVLTDPSLRAEIDAHTRSDGETASILRSIERFGHDASVRYYEMTPVARRAGARGPASHSWAVRAIR